MPLSRTIALSLPHGRIIHKLCVAPNRPAFVQRLLEIVEAFARSRGVSAFAVDYDILEAV